MSNGQEHFRKTLGISEYPWSSDDEEVTSPPAQAPNNCLFELRNAQKALIRAHSSSQPGPSTSTSNVVTQSGQPQGGAQVPATTAAGEEAARKDRSLFWSMLCDPNRPRLSMVTHPRVVTDSARRDPARGAAPRRLDAMGRRVSPLREIRGILAIKKAAAKRLNHHRASLSYPNLTTPLHGSLHNRSASASLPSKNPLFTPCSATATLEANLRASRSRRAYNERMARAKGQAIPSTSGLGRPAEPAATAAAGPASQARHVFHTAPSPSRAGDHSYHAVGSEVVRSLAVASDSDVEISSPGNRDAGDRCGSTAAADDSPRTSADVTVEDVDVEVLDEPDTPAANLATAEGQGQDVTNPIAEAATASNVEARGVKRKKESKDDTVKELNQCLLRLLECPVCLEWMEPPMSQCRRGHLVCAPCRARLAACPVCRTAFSSVRNRAMEGVAEMLRYPCRHSCGREVRLRRRATHEASCARRRYLCPAPACAARAPLARDDLPPHFQSKHAAMLRNGRRQKFTVKVNLEQHDNWLILALDEIFHLRIDVDIRTWSISVYTVYIGPRNNAKTYTYEITVVGNHNSRKLVYARATHSDLESTSVSASRQDCFRLSLDQAVNFLRRKNRNTETDNTLTISLALSKNEFEVDKDESGD